VSLRYQIRRGLEIECFTIVGGGNHNIFGPFSPPTGPAATSGRGDRRITVLLAGFATLALNLRRAAMRRSSRIPVKCNSRSTLVAADYSMILHTIQCKAWLSISVMLLLVDVAAGQFKVVQVEPTGLTASAAMAAGTQAYQRGALSDAVGYWADAQFKYDKLGQTRGRIDARINAAAGLQMLGQYGLALNNLTDARSIATRHSDNAQLIAIDNSLGALLTLTRRYDRADEHLRRALSSARSSNDDPARASILNNLGILAAARDDLPAALAAHEQSFDLARQAGLDSLSAKAAVNAAMAANKLQRAGVARTFLDAAGGLIAQLPDDYAKTFLLISLAQTEKDYAQLSPDGRAKAIRTAYQSLLEAARIAAQRQDTRIESNALGDLAALYELNDQFDEALTLSRKAAFLAQSAQAPELLYRWQWQIGRVLTKRGAHDEAIGFYHKALTTLEQVRADLAAGCGNQAIRSGFRQSVGPLFMELVDLYFHKADRLTDQRQRRAYLLQARQIVEQFKSAELSDYFQDDCLSFIQRDTKAIEATDPHTAVAYLITLPDRSEMLLSIGADLKRFTIPVGNQQLTQEAAKFRVALENRTVHRYMRHSRKLYQWLIAPMEPALEAAQIDTIVFVPDGEMRTVPMGALHDGKQFLVSKYALAITPGLTLMDPKPIVRGEVRILSNGLAEAVDDFPALPYVPAELDQLDQLFVSRRLQDKDFVVANVEQELSSRAYSIVHIASHGKFDADPTKTFVLAYDQKLTLDGLERLIRPSRFRGDPIELLTLSACQTVAGDDRAALGLAGVAIRAGARSALATLWFVNDEASSLLVVEFYRQLQQDPKISKAKALQRAQQTLIKDRRYRHPCYWSPYLIIGNWL
jgi:CHAT domain-containing protein